MGIKSAVNEEGVNQEKPFPKLMIGRCGSVVLFYRKNEGVLLDDRVGGSSGVCVAKYYDGWITENFQDFTGSITLTNED